VDRLHPDDIVGVQLVGGPKKLNGWKHAYSLREMGGWPMPDYLAALYVMNRVVVALPVKVPDEFKKDMVIYRKLSEIKAPDPSTGYIMRGATYEAVN
jgi:hypothetical protein